ncbi:uncharacterized protein LOC116301975 isoform X2 [Actinia tenebrosa]|uniref:Uncharacterized protein LOC116301975 isoform X2 n=1 Tax=Actinia tenebrosa TaxID=6105 RepID=A0A6P8IJU5_ACTTE|nr:uncharacterized protein LOC116301975 isoform X2 [Actinia tenebrosa]
MAWLVVITLASLVHLQSVSSIFLPYWKAKNHTENSFHIPLNALAVDADVAKFGTKMSFLQNMSKEHSLDERCETGLPMSIAWHHYAPYVTMHNSVHKKKVGFTVAGMFPAMLTQILSSCCHPNSSVTFGKFLRSARHGEESFVENNFDITFPLYGYEALSNSFRSHAFISLVRAPRVILLVHDNQSHTQTSVLVKAIIGAWPMLIFILVTALFSGIVLWFLDHNQNPDEFPPPFLRGAWEGFWWALVTMTTVGYGDRSPKSPLGRVFCIVWIITGVIIVSIFTALVTASLSASTYPNFNIHGSKIGAVNGSEEFRLGVSMNADMKVFLNVMQITKELLKNEIDGALVDNYVITHFLEFIKDEPIRVEKYIEHPITYGVVLARNSSRLERCIRHYIINYPQEIFERIAENLIPLKNPTDDVSQQLKAAESLFYQEKMFSHIMFAGLGLVGTLFLVGIIWEFAYRRPKIKNQRICLGPKMTFSSDDETVKLQATDESPVAKLDDMIGHVA